MHVVEAARVEILGAILVGERDVIAVPNHEASAKRTLHGEIRKIAGRGEKVVVEQSLVEDGTPPCHGLRHALISMYSRLLS